MIAAFLSLLVVTTAVAPPTRIHRFAVLVGKNDGGHLRGRLRYAIADAEALGEVLEELGGLAHDDTVVLREPSSEALREALQILQGRVAASQKAHERVEVLFYYSGHSDQEGLLLGESRVSYGQLRQLLNQSPAEVRIAILDSCASGAFVRTKGGVRRPAFVDESASARGHAFITSSAESELAQESENIGGSFFTHYLISGLRGAADSSGDGKVTLNEAYKFAFDETLRRTERSLNGPQHAGYDIQLAGSGDLVMTDIRSTEAQLVLAPLSDGRYFIRDVAGRLFAELSTGDGKAAELGLSPGDYQVTLERRGLIAVAKVTLSEGQQTLLADGDFMRLTPERPSTAKGGDAESARPFALSFLPAVSTNPREGDFTNKLAFNVLSGSAPRLHGVAFALGLNQAETEMIGAQIAFAGNISWGGMRGVQSAWGFSHVTSHGSGIMASGLFNTDWGGFDGWQVAGGFSLTQGLVRGVQTSFLFNWDNGRLQGLAASAALNVARQGFAGLQVTLGQNVALANGQGLQASFIGNFAQDLAGAQISLLNVGADIAGAQIGAINIARHVSGLQLGVLNIAKHVDGAAIGAISYDYDTGLRWQLFAGDVNPINLALLFGSDYFYGLLRAGYSPAIASDEQHGSYGLGFGGHVPWRRVQINFDTSAQLVQLTPRLADGSNGNFLFEARLLLGYAVSRHFTPFIGPTYDVSLHLQGSPNDRFPFDRRSLSWLPQHGTTVSSNAFLRYWPGFVVGVQI